MFHQQISWFCATNMAEMSWRLVRKYLASVAKKHCRKMLWHLVKNIQWLLTDVQTQSCLRLSTTTTIYPPLVMKVSSCRCDMTRTVQISIRCAWHVQMCTCGLQKCKMPASPRGDWAVLCGRRSFLQSTERKKLHSDPDALMSGNYREDSA